MFLKQKRTHFYLRVFRSMNNASRLETIYQRGHRNLYVMLLHVNVLDVTRKKDNHSYHRENCSYINFLDDHRKHKTLKVGGGHLYDRSSV
jgi:hypothetical protein